MASALRARTRAPGAPCPHRKRVVVTIETFHYAFGAEWRVAAAAWESCDSCGANLGAVPVPVEER